MIQLAIWFKLCIHEMDWSDKKTCAFNSLLHTWFGLSKLHNILFEFTEFSPELEVEKKLERT